MAWSLDARIPVLLGSAGEIGAADAVLLETGDAPDAVALERFEVGHVAGCECCGVRSSAALALDRLFQRRVRGQVGFFTRVIAVTSTADGDVAVWAALQSDPVASARYRLVEAPSGTS